MPGSDFDSDAESISHRIEDLFQLDGEFESDLGRIPLDYYRSCVRSSDNDENYGNWENYEELVPILGEIISDLGGWPVVEGDDWDEDGFVWNEMQVRIAEMGFPMDAIVEMKEGTNLRNKGLVLQKPVTVSSSLDIWISEWDLDEIMELAVMMGAVDNATTKEEMRGALRLQTALAEIPAGEEDEERMVTASEVRDWLDDPGTPWEEFLTESMEIFGVSGDDEGVEPVFKLKHGSYLKGLVHLMAVSRPRDVANYMIYKMVKKAKSMVAFNEEFRCRYETVGSFPLEVTLLYLDHYGQDDSATETARKMSKEIIKVFKDMIREKTWLAPETKERLLNKADSMYFHIGNPREILDKEAVAKIHGGLRIDPTNYLQNVLNAEKRKRRHFLDRELWEPLASPLTVNAFNYYEGNFMEMPMAFIETLTRHFSTSSQHNLYGPLGWVIGHEIGHGFEDGGINYNAEGYKAKMLDAESEATFREIAECFKSQYSGYITENGDEVDGNLTLSENLADNAGIRAAYAAYKESFTSPNYPNLYQYNPDQRFWITAANFFCASDLHWSREVHSPEKFRVNGAFSNMEEFARDFNCPKGSAMNSPEKRCQLW